MKKNKQPWTFKDYTQQIADTGDYSSCVLFTNGEETFETYSEDIDEDELKEFCRILNLMPDIWSHRRDAAEFEVGLYKRERKLLLDLLIKLKDENMCSEIGDEMITEVFSKINL
jgi:hypothetical protein